MRPWLDMVIFVVLGAILVALLLVLAELRRLAKEWGAFVHVARQRTGPLAEHMANAIRNLDHVCQVARDGADRIDRSLGQVAEGVDKATGHVRTRLSDLSALADFAQSEAEEAVLDAAAKVRVLRRGAGLAGRLAGTGRNSPESDASAAQDGAERAAPPEPSASEDEPALPEGAEVASQT